MQTESAEGARVAEGASAEGASRDRRRSDRCRGTSDDAASYSNVKIVTQYWTTLLLLCTKNVLFNSLAIHCWH